MSGGRVRALIVAAIFTVAAFTSSFESAAQLPMPGGGPSMLQNTIRSAQNAEISLDELAQKLLSNAERSADFEGQISKIQIQIPGFADVLGPLLIERLDGLLGLRMKANTGGFKALTLKVFPEDSSFYFSALRRATLLDNLDFVKSLLSNSSVAEIDSEQMRSALSRNLSAGFQAAVSKGLWAQEPLFFLRRLAEYDTFWAPETTRPLAEQVLAAIQDGISRKSFSAKEWPLDSDVTANYFRALAAADPKARSTLSALFSWRVLDTAKQDQGQSARFYFAQVLSWRPDPNELNNELRLEIARVAQGESARQFAGEQVQDLQRRGNLGKLALLSVAYRGYFGAGARWAIIGISVLLVLLLAVAIGFFLFFKTSDSGQPKKKRRRRGPGYNRPIEEDRDDEYAQLLARFGLKDDATEAQIKKAFRSAAKKHHPDAQGAKGVATDAEGNRDDTFEDLHKAYDRIMEMRGGFFGVKKK